VAHWPNKNVLILDGPLLNVIVDKEEKAKL